MVVRAEHLPRVEVQHLLRVVKGQEDRVPPVDAAGRVLGVAHVGVHSRRTRRWLISVVQKKS